MAAVDAPREQTGYYCSTSGTYFASKDDLADHYKSDFHRYNLKRKVAGLPPVTKDWFEARKAQLSSAAAGASAAAPVQRLWIEPLTKKKFNTENTYQAFVRSKKYLDLVRKSGAPAPPAIVVTRQEPAEGAQQAPGAATTSAPGGGKVAGFKLVPPSGGLPGIKDEDATMASPSRPEEADDEDGDEDGWETASDEEEAAELAAQAAAEGADTSMQDGEAQQHEEWDVCRSLFDNHISANFQANLEYMFKNFGFYLPDSEYLRDPEGLVKYLGAKLQEGGVPLYVRGDDAKARQFRSLHAVQRHMVDTCQCRMVYDDNEEEYDDFYDYDMGAEGEEAGPGGELVVAGGEGAGPGVALAGFELVVGGRGEDGLSGGKVLGNREFARYYRQRHRPDDERRSVVINTMLSRYRALGAPTSTDDTRDRRTKKEATMGHRAELASRLKMGMIKNVLKKLPKNCEY